MDLLKELKNVIENYEASKKRGYAEFVDLTCEIFENYTVEKPGIILILPLEWQESMNIGLIYEKKKRELFAVTGRPNEKRINELNRIYWDVETPHGVLDMVIFARIDKPKYYRNANALSV